MNKTFGLDSLLFRFVFFMFRSRTPTHHICARSDSVAASFSFFFTENVIQSHVTVSGLVSYANIDFQYIHDLVIAVCRVEICIRSDVLCVCVLCVYDLPHDTIVSLIQLGCVCHFATVQSKSVYFQSISHIPIHLTGNTNTRKRDRQQREVVKER